MNKLLIICLLFCIAGLTIASTPKRKMMALQNNVQKELIDVNLSNLQNAVQVALQNLQQDEILVGDWECDHVLQFDTKITTGTDTQVTCIFTKVRTNQTKTIQFNVYYSPEEGRNELISYHVLSTETDQIKQKIPIFVE